jgi:hypothetical protein
MGYFLLVPVLILLGLAAAFFFIRILPELTRKLEVKDAELSGYSAGKNYNPKFDYFDSCYRNTYTSECLVKAYDDGFKRGTARRDAINAVVKQNAAAYQK